MFTGNNEPSKGNGLFKQFHSFLHKSLRNKGAEEEISQNKLNINPQVDNIERPDLHPLEPEKSGSDTRPSLDICCSPSNHETLTRKSSVSIASPGDSETSEFSRPKEDKVIAGILCKSSSGPMMLNANESQHTLINEIEPILTNTIRRNTSFKRRDLASPIVSQKTKLRRTHSMFADKNEVKVNGVFVPIYDSKVAAAEIPIYYEDNSTESLPRISVQSFSDIVEGKYDKYYSDVYIVDCRFEYEFNGGHIIGAVNISKQKSLEEEFVHRRHLKCRDTEYPPLIIFHCEFSSYRGPIMASHLRTCDRILNHETYPKLHYPDILILEGGFKSFFDMYPKKCLGTYVCMNSKNHEMELGKFKKDSKKLMTRANSTQIFQLKDSIRDCTIEDKNLDFKDYGNSDIYLDMTVPPRLCLEKYGVGSPTSNRSNSSKSSLSTSSKLLLMEELNGYSPDFYENRKYDEFYGSLDTEYGYDSDQYSFEIGDEGISSPNTGGSHTEVDLRKSQNIFSISNKKKLFPELLDANK